MLSEEAELCYGCEDVYRPGDDCGIMWDDPEVGIEWPALRGGDAFGPSKLFLSDKDGCQPSLSSLW